MLVTCSCSGWCHGCCRRHNTQVFLTDEPDEAVGAGLVLTGEILPEQVVFYRVAHTITVTAGLLVSPCGETLRKSTKLRK